MLFETSKNKMVRGGLIRVQRYALYGSTRIRKESGSWLC